MRSDRNTRRSAILGTTAMSALAVAAIVEAFAPDAPLPSLLATSLVVGVSLAVLADIAFARPLVAELDQERRRSAAIDAELRLAVTRRGFAEQLDRAIEMADTEDEALDIVGRALMMVFPDRDNFVLLAPATEPRVSWSIPVGPDGLDIPEAVGEAMRCSALGRGDTVMVGSSGELDACPHLAVHRCEVSSLCVPIVVDGRHLGVAHSAGAAGDVPDEDGRRLVEMVARRVGSRLATLRSARGRHDAVTIDPITGLPTHTTGHRRLRELLGGDAPFSIAVCDVDGFAGYNDDFGAEAADEALRVYADVAGATLRPGDTLVRLPGDRFLCVFADCERRNATAAMERVREALVLEVGLSERPSFTVSVGIVDHTEGDTVEELLIAAQAVVDDAKDDGGNRVLARRRSSVHLPDPRN